MESTANINKLVSLTFDEKPDVRKEAAKRLGEMDDPAAMFALVELTFDKDQSVRSMAQEYLDKKKQAEPDIMSFATIFAPVAKDPEEKQDTPTEMKDKVLRPITQIFERRYGKEKAEMVRSKMMPSIEKIYQKAHSQQSGKKQSKESGRKVMQEFLTSYLEVISDLDRINGDPIGDIHPSDSPPPEEAPTPDSPAAPDAPAAEPEVPRRPAAHAHPPKAETNEDALSAELESVGRGNRTDNLALEIASVESQEMVELKEQQEIEHLPDTFFKKAYEVMMLSNGDDDMMKQEMERMIVDAQREIGLAFRMAKKRFKETKITNITNLQDGMRNVNSDNLTVKSVENMEYQKTKSKKETLTRLLVNDEAGNEGVVYLFDSRGQTLAPGMRIKVVKGIAKTFDFSGETALALGKKGNVYIVL